MKFLRLLVCWSLLLSFTGFAAESFVYFGTYTGAKSKGIYVSRFDSATGKPTAPELAAEIENPTFLAVAPGEHFLFAVSEVDKIGDKNTGAVKAYAVDAKTGKLTALNQQDSGGAGPCHISVDATGKCLLVATTPDNRFVLNCDLGLDRVFAYEFNAEAPKLMDYSMGVNVAPGSGPRHLVYSPDRQFVYVINEMGGTISVFSYHELVSSKVHELVSSPVFPVMTEVQTVSSLPKDFSAPNTSAEIVLHPSGKFLYASNRGHNSIALFSVDQKTGKLTFVEHQSTLGRTPRHFTIDLTGRWLIAENQASDSVVMFAIDTDTGKLKPSGQTLTVGSPVCAVFVGAK